MQQKFAVKLYTCRNNRCFLHKCEIPPCTLASNYFFLFSLKSVQYLMHFFIRSNEHSFSCCMTISYLYKGCQLCICPPPLTLNHSPLVHLCNVSFSPVSLLQIIVLFSWTFSPLSMALAVSSYTLIVSLIPIRVKACGYWSNN